MLGVVVVALLFMSTRFPKTAFSIIGALVIGAAVIVVGTRDDAEIGRLKLPVADVVIENAVIAPAYGGSYQFNARLVNAHAAIQLKEFVISITMLDCDGGGECAVIGQADERVTAKIPPGQARDISRNLFFDGAAPAGTVKWEYKITETRS